MEVDPVMDDTGQTDGQNGVEVKAALALECRKCGCRHFYVSHTRAFRDKIVRYRHCRNCGKRLVTTETVTREL